MERSNSISSVSSRASSIDSTSEESIQIFVKNVAGDTIPIKVPSTTTISTLKSLLALRTNHPQPSTLRLVHAGHHLSPSSTLSDSHITHNSTLHMALPLLGGAPKKIRCNAKDCKDAAQRIVGDCGFCQGHFCGKHRMLESHNCPGLEDCKKEDKERNREKLESERTAPVRAL